MVIIPGVGRDVRRQKSGGATVSADRSAQRRLDVGLS